MVQIVKCLFDLLESARAVVKCWHADGTILFLRLDTAILVSPDIRAACSAHLDEASFAASPWSFCEAMVELVKRQPLA
jgi:hypothetical protein